MSTATPSANALSLPDFLRALWTLTRPYWYSEEKVIARGLLFAILALNLGLVFMQVLFNSWHGEFYNSLQEKNSAEFQRLLLKFALLAGIHIVMAVYQLYLTLMLQIRWRSWLTDRFFEHWLGNQVYYRLELKDYGSDNPDQRISEDLKTFSTQTLDLAFGLLRQIVTLVSFVGILWSLSGPLSFTFGGTDWTIPGYMVWVALIYSIAGTWLTHNIGQPLTGLNFDQQRYEADLRYNMVRVRENAEGIALYSGEKDEQRGLGERFHNVQMNWWELMKYKKRLQWFTTGYDQVASIFPFMVAAPRYFSGAIQLGGLMQTASAFNRVQDALSWFIGAYTDLASWRASVNRLLSFMDAIDRAAEETQKSGGIAVEYSSINQLAIDKLAVRLPDGEPLIATASAVIQQGEHTLVRGPSGTGKSTLFRALSGIWPFGSGKITLPPKSEILFLPQRPYLPIGTLREVVSYPLGPERFDSQRIVEVLRQCKLEGLVDRLDEHQSWEMRLSPGEQQRLAFARALLVKPRWLFLDEATASLDDATEQHLYSLLRNELPDTTVISIAHKATVTRFHRRAINLVPEGRFVQLALENLA
jgi:vitamin B12/bleomycin/antimicrobial peptide transport system ATP-binding/permease protein